jgi:GTP-binding protein
LTAEFLSSAARAGDLPPESLPEVAFLGRSNVGKSSLLNALVGQRKLAFTSSTPGRTQTINFYRVDGKYHFVDLPGYGYAKVPVTRSREWKALIEHYLLNRRTLQLSVILLDVRRGWMETDLELKQWLEHHRKRFLVVATKFDKLKMSEQSRSVAALREPLEDAPFIPFSAVTGQGTREIWQAICKIQNRT